MLTPSPDTRSAAIRAELDAHPGAALEDGASCTGASVADVLACLPEGEASSCPARHSRR